MPRLLVPAVLGVALLAGCAAGDATLLATPSSTPAIHSTPEKTAAEPTPGETAEPTEQPTPTTSTYSVGDVITITENGDPWANFTVLEVQEKAEFVDPDGYYTDTPQVDGYVYIAANVRYEALTDGVNYGSYDFQVFVDGRAVEGFAFAINGPEPTLSSGTLPTGRVAEGWLLYEVPPSGEVLLSYSGNIFINEAPIFEVVLRDA